MTVGNPENFQVKLTTGREDIDKRVPCDFSNLTLKKLLSWIDSQPVNSLIKDELKKSASRYPHQALPKWKEEYSKHLSRAQAKLRLKRTKKAGLEEVKEIEERLAPAIGIAMRASDMAESFDNDFDGETTDICENTPSDESGDFE